MGGPRRDGWSEAMFCFASDPILWEGFPDDPCPPATIPPASLSPVAHCPELQNLLYKFYLPLLEGLGARSAHG